MPPFVSVLTPTNNRRFFLEQLLRNYAQQDYPAARRELLVLDDGSDRVEDIFSGVPGVRYVRSDEVQTIGRKRNRLIDMARGDVIVHMDDDDYYPPGSAAR
jgi:glycosyltransferase involved in cell wall biosynthesis